MFDISPVQILIVLVIALLIFGPKRLPEMGKSIGRGIREFKGAILDDEPSRPSAPETTPAASPVAAPVSTASDEHRDEDDEEVLDGIVLSGDAPPTPPAGPGATH